MAQIFHRRTNTLSRLSIFGGLFGVAGTFWLMGAIERSPYITQAGVVRAQPVPFSHSHHVGALGIDCRYCHTSVEEAASAGIPPTKTCMTCHSILWDRSEMLEPVRESYRTDRSIPWTRVHDLPDYAYFDHSIHVAKGIGCQTCHGRVDEMPLMWRQNTLHMEWCLQCHRDPAAFIRPRDAVFEMDWESDVPQGVLGPQLVERYDVQGRTSCSTCHR